MMQRFDHLVLGVDDLRRAEADFRDFGFDVLDRMDATGPMHNRLVRFSDGSFIELLAFAQDSTHRFFPRWTKGSGWIDYAMNSSDFGERTNLLEARVGTKLPRRSLSKLSPSVGKNWELDLIEPGVGGIDQVLPFLIEERTPSDWRLPKLSEDVVQPHGITGVAGVTVVTDDIENSKLLLSTLFGQPRLLNSRYGTETVAVLFDDGRNWVELVQPISNATALGAHIQKFGTGLYAATLRGNETVDSLRVATKYGARLSVTNKEVFPFS